MLFKKQFGQRVQETRKLHNETQKDLGDVIDTRPNNVSEMESGKKTTTAEKIAKRENIDKRTVYRDVDICVADLTALLFGVGGIESL